MEYQLPFQQSKFFIQRFLLKSQKKHSIFDKKITIISQF